MPTERADRVCRYLAYGCAGWLAGSMLVAATGSIAWAVGMVCVAAATMMLALVRSAQ